MDKTMRKKISPARKTLASFLVGMWFAIQLNTPFLELLAALKKRRQDRVASNKATLSINRAQPVGGSSKQTALHRKAVIRRSRKLPRAAVRINPWPGKPEKG